MVNVREVDVLEKDTQDDFVGEDGENDEDDRTLLAVSETMGRIRRMKRRIASPGGNSG